MSLLLFDSSHDFTAVKSTFGKRNKTNSQSQCRSKKKETNSIDVCVI